MFGIMGAFAVELRARKLPVMQGGFGGIGGLILINLVISFTLAGHLLGCACRRPDRRGAGGFDVPTGRPYACPCAGTARLPGVGRRCDRGLDRHFEVQRSRSACLRNRALRLALEPAQLDASLMSRAIASPSMGARRNLIGMKHVSEQLQPVDEPWSGPGEVGRGVHRHDPFGLQGPQLGREGQCLLRGRGARRIRRASRWQPAARRLQRSPS